MNKPPSFSVRPVFSFFLTLLVFQTAPLFSAPPSGLSESRSLRSFQLPADWQKKNTSEALRFTDNQLELPLQFPGINTFSSRSPQPFLSTAGADFCKFTFTLPSHLPPGTEITFYAVDHDFLWWQTTRKLTAEIVLPLTGTAASGCWQPRQHQRIWHDRIPGRLREWGFQIHPSPSDRTALKTTAVLQNIEIRQLLRKTPLKIQGMHWKPDTPGTGDMMEMAFQLNRLDCSPFNPQQIHIDCILTLPNKQKQSVRCFYYEDFLYHPEERDKTKCLTPYGQPDFRLRFTPLIPGAYSTLFQITEKGHTASYPGPSFTVDRRHDHAGFIRPDPRHPTFLMHDDGKPFFGLGMNVRSPYDNRYKQVAPYSLWEDRGLQAYEHLFRKYEQYGINVAEVWMSSWWLALEWIPDSPGFHGVGHYNQYRAWMLDHIFRLAEKHHIYLILVFNNHGKFGMTFDTEWKRNPYNKANGGFLEKCEDYYTSEQARQAFRNTADYIVSRWGYSPNILMWKLFTEVDLTGPSLSFYHHPSVAAWHREMGDYLHRIDPHRRMVTTHWMLGYHRINDAIATLPQLDCLTTDAYYQSGGSKSLVSMLRTSSQKARGWKKPLIITEFGGSSYADNMGNLMKQVELGLWTGLFNEYSVLPMYWWFALVEDKNLYHYYHAVRKFAEGEDRRGMKISHGSLAPAPKISLELNEMRDEKRILLWIYDRNFFYSSRETDEPQKIKNFFHELTMPKGRTAARIEYWDTSSSEIFAVENNPPHSATGKLTLKIPSFRRALAAKIYFTTDREK